MLKKIILPIAGLLLIGLGVLFFLRSQDLKKKEAMIADYESVLADATKTLDKITDRASLDAEMSNLQSVMKRYAANAQQVSNTFFTIEDADTLRTEDRMDVVDEPMKASRTRVIKLFTDDPNLQRELIELLKPMPHLQALSGGKLALEREFDDLFRTEVP